MTKEEAISVLTAYQMAIPELKQPENPWRDPENELPPDGVEVLVIARTEHAESAQYLAIFSKETGWFLTDVEYDLFAIKAWMAIPEWEGWCNE